MVMYNPLGRMSLLQSGALALSLNVFLPLTVGCGGDDKDKGSQGTIDPLAPPSEDDTTIPPTPRNDFGECFPPNQALSILIDGEGTVTGGSRIVIDRESLCFSSDSCDAGASSLSAHWRWACPPLEINDTKFDGWQLMNARSRARQGGESLSKLTRPGLTGSWADQFPESVDAAHLGMTWLLDLDFNPTSCNVDVAIHGAVMDPSLGLVGPLDRVVIPLYVPRSDGKTRIAAADFSNEHVFIEEGPLEASLRPDTPVTVEGTNFSKLTLTLTSAPRVEAEAGNGGSVAPVEDGGSSGSTDSGIPPLAPPDAGMGD